MLLECDRRRQSVDGVDFRHAHLIDEPPRIRRYGFEVSALRFGVERAECQRGLARSRYTGEDDQRLTGNIDVDILEVVLAGSAYLDEIFSRRGPLAFGHAAVARTAPLSP